MPTELIPFEYNGRAVPVRLDAVDQPLWRAADVGKALSYKGDMGQHLRRLDEDERTLISNQGGDTEWWVNEAGLFSFILGSRKPEAKAFKRWVTHEVLPSIRKTGQYQMAPAIERFPELRAIVELAQSTAEARLAAQEAKVEASEAKALAQTAIETQHFLTIREYVFLHHLTHQLTPSMQTAYGRWLAGYCLEQGIPVRRVQVADRQYDAENGYHTGTIDTTLPGWLTRRHGQGTLTMLQTRGGGRDAD